MCLPYNIKIIAPFEYYKKLSRIKECIYLYIMMGIAYKHVHCLFLGSPNGYTVCIYSIMNVQCIGWYIYVIFLEIWKKFIIDNNQKNFP